MKQFNKPISRVLLLIFLIEIISPNVALALTGGPSQPEVQSFEPIGTTQMVDPFSGDFTYNIPLMDIDGYPVNISYHSGVTMDQEASWVGLGWNLNPGAINRNMRGLPDDFNGDQIKRQTYLKPNINTGVNFNVSSELFGFGKVPKMKSIIGDSISFLRKIGLQLAMGINYNNYKGLGNEFSIGAFFTANQPLKGKFLTKIGMGVSGKLNLSFKSSSQEGFSVSSDRSLSLAMDNISKKFDKGIGFSVNSSIQFNSVSGIQKQMGFGMQVSKGDFKQNIGASYISYSEKSYSPKITYNMSNYNINVSGKIGKEIQGKYSSIGMDKFFTKQELDNNGKEESAPAYGIYYAENAENNSVLDFNREKDGSFTINNPNLPIPIVTNDLYSFSGQGTGGMFKTYRSDLGQIYDKKQTNKGLGGKYAAEAGFGSLLKIGIDLNFNWTWSYSQEWKNELTEKLKYRGIQNGPLYEPAYFKSIGERTLVDEDFYPYTDIHNPEALQLELNGKIVTVKSELVKKYYAKGESNKSIITNSIVRNRRDKRGVYIGPLTASQSSFCVDQFIKSTPYNNHLASPTIIGRASDYRKAHHFSQLSAINPDGNRYIYGIPAYNSNQIDFSFTNAPGPNGSSTLNVDCKSGHVEYDETQFGDKDRDLNGIDRYFDKSSIPAYAHSYLLTSILSPDYVDSDNIQGPSTGDYGNYTKINYHKVNYTGSANGNYRWRVPVLENKANYNRGLYNDDFDDNASILYGEKEIWHVSTIEGRNTIAKFYISARKDALGVQGVHGGLDPYQTSFKLDSIKLYSKNELIVPIKSVYFVYDYSLCKGVHNNIDYIENDTSANTGKLTLLSVYFTYGNSQKGKYNAYSFNYGFNPSYNLKAYDRWGHYKPNNISNCLDESHASTGEFPYVIQNKELADLYTSAWCINQISLPSGGKINIEFESDDYAYVQNKVAMQMYQVIGAGATYSSNPESKLIKNNGNRFKTNNNFLFVELPDNQVSNQRFNEMAMRGGSDLLYSFMVNLNNSGFDFANIKLPNNTSLATTFEPIKGYVKTKNAGVVFNESLGRNIGWIEMEGVNVSDEVTDITNPITKAAWQFTRINMPYLINPGANLLRNNGTVGENYFRLMKTIVGFIPDMINNFFDGNKKLRNAGYASEFNPSKSWIRLNNMSGKKFGGGCRVKKISISDEWSLMDPSATGINKSYGQIFSYTKVEYYGDLEMEISSGVASYEPIIGNEENPFRKPNYYSVTKERIPDDDYFSEEPFGESLFPSPQVGYSKVTIKSIQPNEESGLAPNKTGKVVHEFYTSFDFPTISKSTPIQSKPVQPEWIWNLIYNYAEEYLTTSQGYLIHLNDMHGKPKATYNFSAANIKEEKPAYAYSGIKYEYYSDTIQKCLNNVVKVINPQNVIEKKMIAVDAEVYTDSRDEFFQSKGGGVKLNLDVITAGVFPIPIPTGIPEIKNEINQYRSVVLMKVVNSYGILKSTTAFENGASLTTENVLFDSETGEVLLTKTQNEFNDYLYNAKYPAHWVYDGMGGAYKNTLAKFEITPYLYESGNHSAFKIKIGNSLVDAQNYLTNGDVVSIGGEYKYWVYKTPSNVFVLLNKSGIVYNFASSSSVITIQVIESGRKNMQTLPVAQYVSRKEPINGENLIHNGNYEILQANVTEFKDNWPTLSCASYANDVLNFNNEAIDIFKYLVKTDQINFEDAGYDSTWDGSSFYDCSSCGTSSINQFADNDSTYLKAIYPKYIDSINLDRSNFRKSVTYGKIHNTNNWNFMILYSLQPFSNIKYKNLVSADEAFLNYTAVLYLISDSTSIGNYISKSIDRISFSGNYSDINRSGYLVFTDSDSVLVEFNVFASISRTNLSPNQEKIVNPFVMNTKNNWKPHKSWVYLDNRNSQSDSLPTDIRNDGSFKTFTNFWTTSGSGWIPNGYPSKWQYVNEVTKYHITGSEVESRNPLNQYSTTIYSNTTHLPIAIGSNCPHRGLIFENFEELTNEEGVKLCPELTNQYFTDFRFKNDDYAHTGSYSYLGGKSFLVKTIHSDVNLNNGEMQYLLDTLNQYGGFSPDSGSYILSAWVKVDNGPFYSSYENAGINIHIKLPGSISTIQAKPSGKIIEGWQRIEKEILFPSGTISAEFEFKNDESVAPTVKTYYDDFRIHPKNSIVKGYVYNTQNKLIAELDENNYATFYEYDEEGNLIRVKKETERGIITIKEVRSSFKKNN